MDRRSFGKYLFLLSAGSTFSLSGCLDATGKENSERSEDGKGTDGESAYPDYANWLHNPKVETDPDGDWYGYILFNPSEVPEGSKWRQPYDGFGIELNLKHYAIDGSMGMMEQNYGSVDVTRYATEDDLWSENPDERVGDGKVSQAVRVERPASTGGYLSEQEVVEEVGGFEIYERGAAVNPDERLLVTSPNEYLRSDVVPEIIRTYRGESEPYAPDDLRLLWDYVEIGAYNEFGLNPKDLETYSTDTEITAFGISQRVKANEVSLTQVELFPDEDSVAEEPQSGRLSWPKYDVDEKEVDGRVVVHETTVDDVLTSY